MKLFTKSYYNPYFVEIGDKDYCLDSIRVFDESGEIARTNCGWFGCNNSTPVRTFDCDCVRKLKVDFKLKTAFIVKSQSNTWSSEPRYDLYLPADVVKLGDPITIKDSDFTLRTTRKSTVYDGVEFTRCYFFNAYLIALQTEYTQICEQIQHSIYRPETDLLKKVDELKAKVTEYLAERDRIIAMPVDEALEEAKRQEAQKQQAN